MVISPAPQRNWLSRLKNLPLRWWITFFAISLVVHLTGVGTVLVLLFGGERGGDNAAESLIISAAADDQQGVDLELPEPVKIKREAEAEMDFSEILEVPLEADFNQVMMEAARTAAIAPTMPAPSKAATQRAARGGGLISGTPQTFSDYIQHLRQTGIDVVFVIDATGSMAWVHDRVRERIEALSQYVRNLVPLARFGVIAYRDYQDPDFVTQISQPSFDVLKARTFMSVLDANGGGDVPEAVTEALRKAENSIAWRSGAQRVLIVVGDAPPHNYEADEALAIAERMKRRGARLSIVDSRIEANRKYLGRTESIGWLSLRSPSARRQDVLPAFRALAKSGGGLAVTLAGERQLMKTLALLIFDDRFHDELAPFLASLE